MPRPDKPNRLAPAANQEVSADEFFVQQIAEHQDRLFGYIFSLLGDHSRASDVLQESIPSDMPCDNASPN